MTEIIATDAFAEWFQNDLTDSEAKKVAHQLKLLEKAGVTLGYPWASDLKGTQYAFRELRKMGSIRVVYAFDPERRAVVIIGGDKAGEKKDVFYRRLIRRAEALWEAYLDEAEGSSP